MQSNPPDYKQARLSELRPLYKSQHKKWSSESLRILPEPEDNYMSDADREASLTSEYLAEQKELKKSALVAGKSHQDVSSPEETSEIAGAWESSKSTGSSVIISTPKSGFAEKMNLSMEEMKYLIANYNMPVEQNWPILPPPLLIIC